MKKKYNNNIIANRYAKALFYYANELKQSYVVYNDILKLESLIYKNSDFYFLIKNPLIKNKKIEIIINLLNFCSSPILKLIELIIKNHRELIIHLIFIEYKKIYRYINKIYKIILITSIYIDKKNQKEIVDKLLKKLFFNFQYEMENKIDNKIIGGFCIYIEEKKLDFTIQKSIINIKNNFIN